MRMILLHGHISHILFQQIHIVISNTKKAFQSFLLL